MGFCFSAGVMAWHDFTGLKNIKLDLISGFMRSSIEKCPCLLHLRLNDSEA